MKSCTTEQFRDCLSNLPPEIRRQAREAYSRFTENPSYPGLRFKLVHPQLPIYSVRISLDYRAVGARDGDTMVWFWVGPHSEYERLLASM